MHLKSLTCTLYLPLELYELLSSKNNYFRIKKSSGYLAKLAKHQGKHEPQKVRLKLLTGLNLSDERSSTNCNMFKRINHYQEKKSIWYQRKKDPVN